MAQILSFPEPSTLEYAIDLTPLTRQQLEARLALLRERLQALNAQEPRSQTCEAYEDWAERHELLEDLADDVLDRLDELD